MLPIIIKEIPQSEDQKLWKQIEKTLFAIAAVEKRDEIDNRDRVAQKVIPMAQSYVRRKQWFSLWSFLSDRQIISVKPIDYKGALLKLWTMQILARCLNIPKVLRSPKLLKLPKPVKSVFKIRLLTFWTLRSLIELLASNIVAPPPKPQKRPKALRAPKPKKAKKKKKVVKVLKPFSHHLLRFSLMVYIADFLDWCKLLDRSQGRQTVISTESRLKHRSSQDYLCLKEVKTYRIGKNVRSMLLKWSGKPHTRLPKKSSDTIAATNRSRRSITQEDLNAALSDNWMDTGAIATRLFEITGKQITFDQASRLLMRRANLGEIYRYKNSKYHLSLFSRNPDAVTIERSWLSLSEAYALAVERGCQCGINTFRKNWVFRYSRFGLEFRKEVPVHENPLLRWRDVI